MMIRLIVLAASAFLVGGEISDGPEWGYDDNQTNVLGPSTWYKDYPDCAAKSQSPIDIIKPVEVDRNLRKCHFHSYDRKFTFKIENAGHTVKVYPVSDKPRGNDISIEDCGLNSNYKFAQMHFHWGRQSNEGSEHTIDGTSYPLELHLVHKSENKDIAVLGVLFKISERDNKKLKPIIDHLIDVRNVSSEFVSTNNKEQFSLKSILPDDKKYYRYQGSLTTPPCTEGVTWTIFAETVPISENQVKEFRVILDGKGKPLTHNFRSPQPLNGRQIKMSKYSDKGHHHGDHHGYHQ